MLHIENAKWKKKESTEPGNTSKLKKKKPQCCFHSWLTCLLQILQPPLTASDFILIKLLLQETTGFFTEKIITALASVKGFEPLFRIDRLKIKLVADDHKEMKFAVKYSKNALGWSHSVPQSYRAGVGAGSNLTWVQCPLGSVWSRRGKELVEMSVPDICTQLWV